MAKIRIQRKPYKRKDGTKVSGTTFLMPDPGRPGRGSRGSEAGPHKGEKKWISHPGKLGGPGYTSRTADSRHRLLSSATHQHGYSSVLGSLQVLLRNSTMGDSKREIVERDKRWLKKKYGK